MTPIDHDNQHGRQQLVDTLRTLVTKGLTSGTSGNVSMRTAAGMIITPTGIAPDQLLPEHIVAMTLDGQMGDDQLTPSSEWRMHADVYHHRPGLEAVVHCHSPYATILACAHKSIPALHYMIAASGSSEIPLATYATFGSQELSDANLEALSSSLACLLANHGQLATGFSLEGALKLAELVEELAHAYWGTLAIGGPELLAREQIDDVMVAFAEYGQQKKRPDLASGNRLNQ
ncbi:class II aldolase [Pseudomaricurvus alkylphenolicus]|jgi:L-fuculose-phosphate aldolase|uniref:class II aldolase/adducin family protein n=1 Tax=Pseudomaricurvus alkylphenolicus TaxID=1306991 RepID=UPI0014218298|nr:class II aldolase/adducin family protein [Pseudomaricurvus alkylphenolicus]NIB42981.1 class II aldolase [Pseudomaricurvus alkylphenolicus]